MCGRFAITLPPEAVRAFFAYAEQPNFPPRYNIAPTQPIPIVTARAHTGGRERHFLLARWGFLPAFVKDPKEFPLIINARAETLAQKPSFRAALKRRRCLVIADGFYEWRREAPGAAKAAAKTPFPDPPRRSGADGLRRPDGNLERPERRRDRHRLHHNDHGQSPDDARPRPHAGDPFARGLLALARQRRRRRAASATALLRPAPEPALELIPIGAAVNRTANDDAAVQAPIGEAIRAAPPEKAR